MLYLVYRIREDKLAEWWYGGGWTCNILLAKTMPYQEAMRVAVANLGTVIRA